MAKPNAMVVAPISLKASGKYKNAQGQEKNKNASVGIYKIKS